MSELAYVKAEIKAWERSFKDSNGCVPTVDDIKQNPTIADKYKLYKKLSKAAASSETAQKMTSAPPPSTPPRKTRPKDPTTVLLSKSRPLQPPAPLSSFNPFSPQKKEKGKQKESPFLKNNQSISNPFPKLEAKKQIIKISSDMFPAVEPSQPSSSTLTTTLSLNINSTPPSAVSRARKRLRGEPVSPSPNKDKRRRVSSQTILSFPRFKTDMPSSEEEEDDIAEANSSFVDNSPVKAPIPGKSYQPLFKDAIVPMDLFGVKGGAEPQRNKSQKVVAINGTVKIPGRRAKQDSTDSAQNSLDPSDTHYLSKLKSGGTPVGSNSDVSSNRSSVKRTFEEEDVDNEPLMAPRAKSPLIPPSPPPGGVSNPFNQPGKSKSKAKAVTSRKKIKTDDKTLIEDDSDDSGSHMSSSKLRIVGRPKTRRQHAATRSDEDAASDSDPILGYTRFTIPHASSQDDRQLQEGDVEVNLPEELRRVLALPSASSKGRVSEEDRLVKGLIYGRRMNNYDPHKGGEIWDVGEDYHANADGGNTEEEDDWEGEPVPWEVGEL